MLHAFLLVSVLFQLPERAEALFEISALDKLKQSLPLIWWGMTP
jgi:hypothetical protein